MLRLYEQIYVYHTVDPIQGNITVISSENLQLMHFFNVSTQIKHRKMGCIEKGPYQKIGDSDVGDIVMLVTL